MLKKRIMSVILCLCMVVGISPTVALAAVDYYIDYDITDTSHPFNGISQWTDEYKKQLRCTYVAWHETKSRLGIRLTNWGDAGSWVQSAKNAGYQTGSTPAVNSIICWSGGYWGHVAFVTEVSGSTITVIEGGYGYNTYPKAHVRTIESSGTGTSGWSNGTFIYLGGSTPSYPTSENLGNDFYAYIQSGLGGFNMANISHNDAYGNVATASANGSDPRQIWHFIWDNNSNAYKIVNMHDGRCLDVLNGKDERFTNMGVCTDLGGNPQRWRLVKEGTGYNLMPCCTNTFVADIADGKAASAVNIRIDQRWYNDAQRFSIVQISNVSSTLTYNLGSSFLRFSANFSLTLYLQTFKFDIERGGRLCYTVFVRLCAVTGCLSNSFGRRFGKWPFLMR